MLVYQQERIWRLYGILFKTGGILPKVPRDPFVGLHIFDKERDAIWDGKIDEVQTKKALIVHF